MTNDVFISYSRKNLDFVEQLHQYLVNNGISAWFDKDDIKVSDHWRTSIVEGIQNCKVFLLVLSPGSAASVNVRKEVDLAERHEKIIVPLMWQQTKIPVAMQYQLAGIQYMDFKETPSDENLNQLANALRELIGGATLAETASKVNVLEQPLVPKMVPEEEPASAGRGRGRGRTIRKKKTVSPITIGGAVISGVVNSFGIEPEDQDWINEELKWLFYASDNFLKIRQGDIERDHPVPISIPLDENEKPISDTDNKLSGTLDEFDLQIWEGQIESAYNRINTYLRNLNILLGQEAKMGDEGKGNVYLQNQIKGSRSEIVKVLQEIAGLMDQAYRVYVVAPEKLDDFIG